MGVLQDVYKTAEAIRAAGGKITKEPGPLPGLVGAPSLQACLLMRFILRILASIDNFMAVLPVVSCPSGEAPVSVRLVERCPDGDDPVPHTLLRLFSPFFLLGLLIGTKPFVTLVLAGHQDSGDHGPRWLEGSVCGQRGLLGRIEVMSLHSHS